MYYSFARWYCILLCYLDLLFVCDCCCLLFVFRYLLFVFRYLLFVFRYLLFVFRYSLLAWLRGTKNVGLTPKEAIDE